MGAKVLIRRLRRFKIVQMVANAGTGIFVLILKVMKRVLTAAVMILMLATARAQKVYFIYIQSDGNTSFFVKLGDKVTNATPSGYLILPNLVDSTYQFTISKTGVAAAESRFTVNINKRDWGFMLKENEGKFSLLDLQSLTLLQPIAAVSTSGEAVAMRTDAFTVLLAQAANDPTLLEIRTAAQTTKAEEKPATNPAPAVVINTKEPEQEQPQSTDTTSGATAVQDNDTAAQTTLTATEPEKAVEEIETSASVDPSAQQAQDQDTAQRVTNTTPEAVQAPAPKETQAYKRSVVTRRAESSTSEGFGLTFLDEQEGQVDTIRIVIPNPAITFQQGETHEDLKKFLNISNVDTTKENSVEAANDKIRTTEKAKRKACSAAASEREFFKLRKNMASEETMML
jgi:hypothetical protein